MGSSGEKTTCDHVRYACVCVYVRERERQGNRDRREMLEKQICQTPERRQELLAYG